MTRYLPDIHNLIFDVDGTLLDSRQDIAGAQLYVLRKLGVTHLTPEDIYPHIGKPLTETFALLLPPELHMQIPRAKETYVTYYRAHMLDTTKLFPGTEETLRALRERGFNLAVATTKSSVTSGRVLKHFGLTQHFCQIQGSDNHVRYKPDPFVINKVIEDQRWDRSGTVMVGDTAADVLGGKNAGIRTIAVTWGALTRPQVEELRPDAIVERYEEILGIVGTSVKG
jgi:HAD superfamily hydrolase (TIGR01509 family)